MIILHKAILDFPFMRFYNIMKYYSFIYFNEKNYLKNLGPFKYYSRYSIRKEIFVNPNIL